MKQTVLISLILVGIVAGILFVSSCNGGGDGNGNPAECTDGLDNDSDGWTDSADPECISGQSETGFGITQCNDNIDNDSDGDIDSDDPGCSELGTCVKQSMLA